MTIMRVGVKSSIFEGTCVSIKALVTYIKLILSTGLRALKCITDHIRRVTGQKLGDINKYIYIYIDHRTLLYLLSGWILRL